MKTKQEGASNIANGMEETKTKTSIVEDSRKRKIRKEKIRRIRRGEWTGMSAGLAVRDDKVGRKGERTMNPRGRVNYRDI